jgi:Asp-tRNA(Asn)/Glu-tRNA(Gln) amidotransferase A subunit family amidase
LGEISPVVLTEESLAAIERLNPALNAFITVAAESALAAAKQAEKEIRSRQWRGPLHGIPIGLKDLIDTAGLLTTAASAQYRNRVPADDAVVVQQLRSAGAVVLGKQNLHEFAYGGSNFISFYGEARNPWGIERITGGSSGGSAASVAAGLGFAAIGTDTAGSVREPAALCGIVGFKPSYGRISINGVVPLSPSLDHLGPISRTVGDAALLFHAIDEHAPPGPFDDPYALNGAPHKLRIGIPRKFFYDDVDPEILRAVEEALAVLRSHGHQLREIELAVPEDRILQNGEAYTVHAELVAETPHLYLPETLRRIRNGEQTTETELNLQRDRLRTLRRDAAAIFRDVDVVITPTTPRIAPAIAELKQDPDSLRTREIELLRNTRPFNVWGLPAISVPCGFTESGLPIGLQIAAADGRDALVLQLAATYERSTAWHKRTPPILN